MKHRELGPSKNSAAECIVWLHGGNVAGWMWGEQLPAFPEYFSLIPDLPGFGESSHEQWISIAGTADQVAELLDGRKAHVVGLSLGSSVALELAARHPRLVRSLFLASTQAAKPRRREIIAGRIMLGLWNQRGFWTTLARSYGLSGDDADLFVTTGIGIRRETAAAILREVSGGISDATLSNLRTPAIAVAGNFDSPAIWRASLDRMRAAGATVAIAPGMHHQFNIENVELFNSALRRWLDSRSVAPGLVDASNL